MNPNKTLIGLCIIFLLAISPSSLALSEETSSVSRIVGDSPTEMLRQLQREEIDLRHATYYTHDQFSQKDEILREQFGNNAETDSYGWKFDDVSDSVNYFRKNELFILESKGVDGELKAKSYGHAIEPKYLMQWQESFEENNPLFVFDTPYGGIYLPNTDTWVSRTARDSSIMAPMSFNSPEFSKSVLCSIRDEKTLGEVFRNARNFHYRKSEAANDNLIGLVLQSYSLFGNPQQRLNMQFTEADRERIRDYCDNFLENLAPDIDFIEKVGNYSKFRKHVTFSIPSYSITRRGDYELIDAENTFQSSEAGKLVVPIAVRTTSFPKNTIITGFRVDNVWNYEDIDTTNLPSYESGLGLVDRACYYDAKSHEVSFDEAYTQNSRDIIATIMPLEVLNCTEGKFRLYRNFNYSIDYIALSPLLIKDIKAPLTAKSSEQINVSIKLLKFSDVAVEGALAILDGQNSKVWEKQITSDSLEHNAQFTAPASEGAYKYSVEFIKDNQTLDYNEFTISVMLLQPKAQIPVNLVQNPSVSINFFSNKEESYELAGKYYVTKDFRIIEEGVFTKTISTGDNILALNFSALKREDKSYLLTIELDYLGEKKTLAYLLATNNPPIAYVEGAGTYFEGDKVVVNYKALDYDNDALDITITDPRFIKEGGAFVWQTKQGDAGIYTSQYSVTDGIDTITHSFGVEIKGQSDTCASKWSCGAWSECANGLKTRVCFDSNNCGANMPLTEITCTPDYNIIINLADGSEQATLSYNAPGSKTIQLKIPKNAEIVKASLSIRGGS